MDEYVRNILAGTEPQIPEVERLDSYQCYQVCESFATQVNVVEDTMFQKTSLARYQSSLKEIRTEIEQLTTKIDQVTNVLRGCEVGVDAIQQDVAQISIRFNEWTHARKAEGILESQRREADDTAIYLKTELIKTNTEIEQLTKDCKEKHANIKNLTCHLTEIEKKGVEQIHRVQDLQAELDTEKAKSNDLKEAKTAYMETKLALNTLLIHWYSMFYEEILAMKKIAMGQIDLEVHAKFVQWSTKTEMAFEAINSEEKDKTSPLPMILTKMRNNIPSTSAESEGTTTEGKTAEHLSKHLEESFSVYAEEFIHQMVQKEETTGVNTNVEFDDVFQQNLMKFMAYCPQQPKSFCGNYLIGWFDPKECNNAKCGTPCIMEGSTCKAPNGAGDYLLELRIDYIYTRLIEKLTELERQFEHEQTVSKQLEEQIKVLLKELGKQKTKHTECTEGIKKVETETLTVLHKALLKINSNVEAIEAQQKQAQRDKLEYEKDGILRMKKIYKITKEMKDRRFTSDEAITAITTVTEKYDKLTVKSSETRLKSGTGRAKK